MGWIALKVEMRTDALWIGGMSMENVNQARGERPSFSRLAVTMYWLLACSCVENIFFSDALELIVRRAFRDKLRKADTTFCARNLFHSNERRTHVSPPCDGTNCVAIWPLRSQPTSRDVSCYATRDNSVSRRPRLRTA